VKTAIGSAITITLVAIALAPSTQVRSLDAPPAVTQAQVEKEPSSYTSSIARSRRDG
jgi:hypothetical protein